MIASPAKGNDTLEFSGLVWLLVLELIVARAHFYFGCSHLRCEHRLLWTNRARVLLQVTKCRKWKNMFASMPLYLR